MTMTQPRALEVRIDGKKFLLSRGDHFVVPPYNEYSLLNHSSSVTCEIGFFIMKNPVHSSSNNSVRANSTDSDEDDFE